MAEVNLLDWCLGGWFSPYLARIHCHPESAKEGAWRAHHGAHKRTSGIELHQSHHQVSQLELCHVPTVVPRTSSHFHPLQNGDNMVNLHGMSIR